MAHNLTSPVRSGSVSSRSLFSTSWATASVLAATATIGTPLSATAESAEPHIAAAPGAMVLRLDQAVSPWERPQDILASINRPAYQRSRTRASNFADGDDQAGRSAETFRFDIAPGSLASALQAFAAATRTTLRVAPDLTRNLTTRGVLGTMTAEQAITELLADSKLSHRFAAGNVLVIDIQVAAEEVTVMGNRLPEVTSPKFVTPLLDTPQTITVVPRTVIQSQGATSLRDILRNVPGITMQAGEGGGGLPGDTLTMRGFSASGDIFIDGVRDVGPYSRDSFNIEQVEVIKGPSSSFGGRGSTGGAINLATKSPQLRAARNIEVGLGGADFRRSTIDVNQPLTALGSSAAGRLNMMWQDAGVPGRDVVENKSWAIAPSLAFGIGKPTRLTLNYQHLQQDNVPDYGLPWGAYTDPATGQVYPTGAFNATPAVDQSNFYGLANYDFEKIDNDVATVLVERDVRPGLTLRNVTRVGDTEREHAITAPRPPNRQLQRRSMQNDTFANQTSLSARVNTGALTHSLSSGVEFGVEDVATRNSAQTANQPSITLQHPDPSQLPFAPMPDITGNPTRTETSTVGAYLFDTVSLTRQIEASGGLRWDRSDVDYRLTTLATGDVTELGRVDRMLSGRAGIVYKPRPNGSIYAGYGTSFNPASDAGTVGAALSASDTSANSVNLKPEKTRNIEFGTKWAAFDDRLQLTGAVFDTLKTNARTRNLTSDSFVLAGKQRVRGVELGVSGEILPGWTALASFSGLKSDIEDSLNTTEEGRDLALTPSRTASLWTTWEVHRNVSIGGGAQYMDAVFRNTTSDLSVPSYWLVNAMASYRVSRHLTLRLNGTNLGDKRYADRVGGGHYVPGPRRTVQVTAGVGF